jgi:hypothetical protein
MLPPALFHSPYRVPVALLTGDEGIYDQLVESDAIEELWQSWEQPEIRRLPHGHVSWMLTPGINRCILDWLALRLDTPRSVSSL